jgi:hypothetical protein
VPLIMKAVVIAMRAREYWRNWLILGVY